MEKAPEGIAPTIGNTYADWKNILKSEKGVDKAFRVRKNLIGLITRLLTPLRMWETFRLKDKLQQTAINPEPVFILGHWRSGTTFLLNLMSRDPQFGFLTNIHGLFPHSFMCNGVIPFVMENVMPRTRPMDNMRLALKSPQEEELALMNMGPYSLYHMWTFPKQIMEVYERTVEFKGAGQKEAWVKRYMDLLRKVSLKENEKRLVLKNPPNTARVKLLLELFPKAKFIHIYRDPYEVYGSSKKLYLRVLPYFQLQEFEEEKVIADIVEIYKRMMKSYLADRKLIPKGNLVELQHQDLAQNPKQELQRIYNQLNLPGFSAAEKGFDEYLQGMKAYQKKKYDLSEEEIATIEREWGFVMGEWF